MPSSADSLAILSGFDDSDASSTPSNSTVQPNGVLRITVGPKPLPPGGNPGGSTGGAATTSAPTNDNDLAIKMAILDQGIAGTLKATPPVNGSVMRSGLAGTNEGIASVLGFPVDATTWALNKGIAGVNKVAGRDVVSPITNPVGGSQNIKNVMGDVGVDTDAVQSNTPVERIARSAGEGLGSIVTGAGAVGGLRAAGMLANRVAGPILDATFGKPDVGTAVMGAGSGAGAQAAEELTPEPYKPIAGVAGGLVGGSLPIAGRAALDTARLGGRLAKDATKPFTRSGQEQIAGRIIQDASSDPAALRDQLSKGTNEIVPGSTPTTFQQTGDMGLGQLERRVRTQNPAPFLDRDASQNSARQVSIQNIQPQGTPTAVADQFRNLRNDLDNQLEGATAAARQRADQAIANLGAGGTAEAHGAVFRGLAQAARDDAKQNERALWNAVDPSGTMTLPAGDIANSARSIESSLSSSAKPMAGEERAVFDVARRYGDDTPFRDVMDLRSRISAEMANEKRTAGYSPVYRRLVQLRGAVEDAIDRGVENQAIIEQRAVAGGRLSPQDTLVARLEQQRAEWYERQTSNARLGTGGGESIGGDAARGPGRLSPVPGSQGPLGNRSRDASGASGLQETTGQRLDAEAADRLKAASAAAKERASTFDRGPIGEILRPAGPSGEYRLPQGAVPAKVFHPGPTGAADVRAFIRAGGQDAVGALTDYAGLSLRQAASRADGSLDPDKARGWIDRHQSALSELPQDVRSRFTNAAQAEDNVAQAVANRRSQLAALDRSAAAKLMGLSDNGDVVRQVGSILRGKTAARDMQQLADQVRGSAAAREGLRRAVIEHVLDNYVGNTEVATSGRPALKSDALQTFIRTKRDALEKIFAPEELGILQAVSRDLQRSNRSIASTKLPGGSNSAQDVYAIGKSSGSILGRLVMEVIAAGAGHAAGGMSGGVAGWLGSKATSALRNAGLGRIDNLVTEAMLRPELARALLAKVPERPDMGTAAALAARAKQLAIISAAHGADQNGH